MAATLTAHCPAIECEGCANSIKRALGKVEGVQQITVDVEGKNVTAQYEESVTTETVLRERLTLAGFPPE